MAGGDRLGGARASVARSSKRRRSPACGTVACHDRKDWKFDPSGEGQVSKVYDLQIVADWPRPSPHHNALVNTSSTAPDPTAAAPAVALSGRDLHRAPLRNLLAAAHCRPLSGEPGAGWHYLVGHNGWMTDQAAEPASTEETPAASPEAQPRRRVGLFAVTAAIVLAADVATKVAVVARLEGERPVRLLGGAAYLVLFRNSGAAF